MTNLFRFALTTGLALVALASFPAFATAQDSPMATHLPRAIAAAARLDVTSAINTNPAADHTQHFLLGAARTTLSADLNSALGMQVSLFPVAVPSDGLMYSPEGGELANRLRMGTSFVERANTLPRGRFTWGFYRQSDNYSKLDGIDLERGELVIYSRHDSGPGAPLAIDSPNDVLEQTITLDFDRNVFAFWGSVGVTDRFELDFVVPIVKVSMDTRIVSRIERAVAVTPIIHAYNSLLELNTQTTFLADSATGLGDVAVRAKGGLYRSDTAAVAAAVTVQLPTGDEDELLGSGGYRTQAQFLWSGEHGRIGTHFNAGYTFSFGEASSLLVATPEGAPPNPAAAALDLDLPAEINFTGGVDVGLSEYVTLVLGARGRYLFEATRFDSRSESISGFQASNALTVTGRGDSLTQAFAVIGTVIRLGSRFQANADIMVPILNNGLVPNITGLGGISVAF